MITVVGNLKGGSGKSTVTFNLAIWLAVHGERVNAFDLDPQRTLTDVAEVRSEEGYTPLFSLHHGDEDIIEEILEKTGEVIIDVGSSDIDAMQAAISIADRIIIPVPPSQADIWSTQRFLGVIRDSLDEKEPEIYVFVNRADTHHAITESDEAEEALAALGGCKLIKQRLHQRTAYRRSFSEGLGVFELQPSSKAGKEFKKFARVVYPKVSD
jgi:chromosome partitioning protein